MVRLLGLPEQAAQALTEGGLPTDCNRMFVRVPGRELETRELPAGRAVFLGAFEDGSITYWLLVDSGEVWMAQGYEDQNEQDFAVVNSSVDGLAGVLKVWESFVYSGKSDEDDDYDDFVEEVIERAGQADPQAFVDEESWWSRAFEEVELGALGPEDPEDD
ncbi:SUKH-4 family immunity protein [Streptomyces sp. SYSU K217416]